MFMCKHRCVRTDVYMAAGVEHGDYCVLRGADSSQTSTPAGIQGHRG